MILKALKDLKFDVKTIQKGLKNIYNPGRFEWISPNILVDTANNSENIGILSKMIRKIWKGKEITVFFGTTQTDPVYAAQLANLIPAHRRILVDWFCERALPCSEYAHWVGHEGILHLDTTDWIEAFHELKKQFWKNKFNLIYGSFYLIGHLMSMSMHKSFTRE
jgi:folylpolyglutamate synthase/dihydropteroate synthase